MVSSNEISIPVSPFLLRLMNANLLIELPFRYKIAEYLFFAFSSFK